MPKKKSGHKAGRRTSRMTFAGTHKKPFAEADSRSGDARTACFLTDPDELETAVWPTG
jgi:hypothetical protein